MKKLLLMVFVAMGFVGESSAMIVTKRENNPRLKRNRHRSKEYHYHLIGNPKWLNEKYNSDIPDITFPKSDELLLDELLKEAQKNENVFITDANQTETMMYNYRLGELEEYQREYLQAATKEKQNISKNINKFWFWQRWFNKDVAHMNAALNNIDKNINAINNEVNSFKKFENRKPFARSCIHKDVFEKMQRARE
jgi:hypothetical protein